MKNRLVRTPSIPAIIGLLLISIQAYAGVPLSETQIPVYPAATRQTAAEKELLDQQSEFNLGGAYAVRSNTIRVYSAKKVVDDVCRFYMEKLKAEPGAPVDDPAGLSPGDVYPPWFELEYYDDKTFESVLDEKGKPLYDGRWVQSAITRRKPWKKDAWLHSAWFEWNATLSNGDMARYSVGLEDDGFDAARKVLYNTTRITIQVLITSP